MPEQAVIHGLVATPLYVQRLDLLEWLPYLTATVIRGFDLGDMITLYTHPDCSYSDALKSELDELEVGYDEIDLSRNPDKWSALEELTGGERITPVMVTGDVVEVGFHGVG